MKFKQLGIKLKFRHYKNLRSFFITECTQIIFSKLTHIDMILIHISVKSCMQIQSKMYCP